MKLLLFVIRRTPRRPALTTLATALIAVLCLSHEARSQPGSTVIKWDQPPAPATNVFYGWNQEAWYEWFQTADDWVCTNDQPVTRIRWWGSFIGWAQPGLPPELPARWRIQIWTDVPPNQPPNPQPFSHPGIVIHEIITNAIPFYCVGVDYHDRDCPGKTPQPLDIETCYLWELPLTPEQYFRQTGPSNIFWISISAVYTNPMPEVRFPFGLKTRPRDPNSRAPDAAVVTTDPLTPVLGSAWLAGSPLLCPEPWDLAFELITGEAGSSKWEQLPDLTTTGIDVNDSYDPSANPQPPPFVIADDFLCTQPGFLTNIVIWGSWLNDKLPINGNTGVADPAHVRFLLSIYDDIPDPDGPGPLHSRPGTNLLWFGDFPQPNLAPNTFSHSIYASNLQEGWMNPPAGYLFPGDTVCHQYEFKTPFPFGQEPFFQEGTPLNPRVYWLVVQAVIPGDQGNTPDRPMFGWKTSTNHWNDDAVWASTNLFGPPVPPAVWNELRYPPAHQFAGQSIDMAFRLNTGAGAGTGGETLKWSQPPVVYQNPTNLFSGWNEPSIYGGGVSPNYGVITNIVADDWLCTNALPISDVHWWGSFLGWQGTNLPPQPPVAFRLSIWKDVPAGADTQFSHPGDLIWEHTISTTDGTLSGRWVGWDVDPRFNCPEVEACFRFDYNIPQPNWFTQDAGSNIYWLSISAVYPDGQLGAHPFGWKTRPHTSPPPDDAVRIFDPLDPALGSIYLKGEPIEYPAGVSWDMAFQLTSPAGVPDMLDFGDAPDPVGAVLFPTRLVNNGARHTVVAGMFLGAGVDVEPDGQPDPSSTGDDINLLFAGIPFPPGDEDGVTFTSPLVPGFLASVDVVASVNGFLNAWIDFGADGSWAQPMDQVFAAQPLVPGVNSLVFFVPAGASPNAAHSRWRFSSTAVLSYTGLAGDGEVEDHRVVVQPQPTPSPGHDFGDAPDAPYPTLIASSGAAHIIFTNFVLGTNIDAEPDGQPGPFNRDDNVGVPDDEDGVNFVTPLARGTVASATVTLSSGFGPGRLDAWVDFNRDGTWSAGEQIATSHLLLPGANSLGFSVPALAQLGRTGARFRLSSTGGLAPTAVAANGEVEDYEVEICQTGPTTNVVFTSITVTNSGTDQIVSLQWNAEVDVAYQVQYTTTLSTPPPITWVDVGPQIVGPANSLTLTNTMVLERYYRVCVPNICP